MPGRSGPEAVRQIKRAAPEAEVVVFSAHNPERIIGRLFDAGAKSYIRKSEARIPLLAAARSVAEHKPFLTPEISAILFARFSYPEPGRNEEDGLPRREEEVAPANNRSELKP